MSTQTCQRLLMHKWVWQFIWIRIQITPNVAIAFFKFLLIVSFLLHLYLFLSHVFLAPVVVEEKWVILCEWTVSSVFLYFLKIGSRVLIRFELDFLFQGHVIGGGIRKQKKYVFFSLFVMLESKIIWFSLFLWC